MTTWLFWFVGALIAFLIFELYALFTRRIPTLSSTIQQLTKRHPLLPFGMGLIVGVLAVHFWGNGWCP